MPRVLNMRDGNIPDSAVYVGRPSKWGNPFKIGRDGSREYVLERHRRWLMARIKDGFDVSELRGKDLVCWCAPEPCHADLLLDIANEGDDDQTD